MLVVNYVAFLMVSVAALLALVIWILAKVLIMISKKVLDASKSSKKTLMIGWIVLGTMFSKNLSAQSSVTDTATTIKNVNEYGGLSYNTYWTLFSVLMTELLVILLLVVFIRNLWKALYPSVVVIKEGKGENRSWLLRTWHKWDKQFFTKAAPIEKEADILLDHDYDGIKELDNALPPWWKFGFYITIFVACVYLLKYEVWETGPNPTQEYASEMMTAKADVEAYVASLKNNVDEKSVTLSDAAGIASGQVSFSKTCVPCHGAKGEGGVGPNLTDDYWIHGGGLADLFKTIKYGYPDKGMQSWQTTYSPVQIQELASYIKSLKGTNPPNAKAPQGDLYKELPVNDSSTVQKTAKDSLLTK
jgi:cytochrome c oxidase cbb3-type subunit 3